MTDDRPLELDDLRAVAVEAAPELASLPIVALGWATVDIDAVVRSIGADPGAGSFAAAPRDEHLGARAVVHRPNPASGEPIQVLLEPDTEGRLAATLARSGEGFAAVWFDGRHELPESLAARLGPAVGGPLGSARALAGGPATGPHVFLLVEAR